jgi:hypothetical protein
MSHSQKGADIKIGTKNGNIFFFRSFIFSNGMKYLSIIELNNYDKNVIFFANKLYRTMMVQYFLNKKRSHGTW